MKLTGSFECRVCPGCMGRKTIPCPTTSCVRSGIAGVNQQGGAMLTPSSGHRIPCPQCEGKGLIAALPKEIQT